jgi:hypothetical protein
MNTATTRPATATDLRNLRAFVANLDALEDWNDAAVKRFARCRAGSRLCDLGWLSLYRPACRTTAGFMGGAYHPATYTLTAAGSAAAKN